VHQLSTLPQRADVVVVGAGILGLATAAELLGRRPDLTVVVLEKEHGVASHQTGRNSCVIHSGIYYTPGSLKAKLCVAGRKLLLSFCEEQSIPYELCGKVIVAADASELGRLDELERRGNANGAAGIRRIGPEELRELEPYCKGVAALAVPETGLVDYRLVAEALRRLVEAGKSEVALATAVQGVASSGRDVVVHTSRGDVRASFVIACAGVHADNLVERDPSGSEDETVIVPFRGDYYAFRPEAIHLCRNLIYPVPDPRFPFLGVHATRRPDGAVWAGPNAVLALAREGYRRRDVDVADLWRTLRSRPFRRFARRYWRIGAAELYRDLSKGAFAAAVRRYLPDVEKSHLTPAPAGIRAQAIRADGLLADDFIFAGRGRVLHVKNAPSPAATSSLAIASMIADRGLAMFDAAS
jgi:L-2-hydroxyglutarate oxidase LhgO